MPMWFIDHLLDNALRFSAPHETVKITLARRSFQEIQNNDPLAGSRNSIYQAVTVADWTPTTSIIDIQLQDRGPGIDPKLLPHIFERFYQTEPALTREHEGLGLGLTICQQIVALHQGLLRVESTAGEGSIFHIVLKSAHGE